MSTTEVAVVAVSYYPGEALTRFLDSLEHATSCPLDIVLADNGSGDGAVEAAVGRPGVRVVETGGNLGFGRAANLGVHDTTAEFVVIANPDVVWLPGSLDALLAAARRWPKGAAFGPLLRSPDGTVYPSARLLPSLGRGIGHALCGWWWPTNPWSRAYRFDGTPPVERTTGWLSRTCLLVRRDAFDEVHGFDPDYFMYFEDLDLGERFTRAGWQNVYVPSAVVLHSGGHVSGLPSGEMTAVHHRSAWRYLSRRYRGLRWLPLRVALRIGLALRSGLAQRVTRLATGGSPQGSGVSGRAQ